MKIIEPLIKISNRPNIHDKYCKVTLNIPWNIAYIIATLFAPLIDAIKYSVDLKTLKEQELQFKQKQFLIREKKQEIRYKKLLFNSLKKVHKEKLDYPSFSSLFRKDNQYNYVAFRRIRAWSIQYNYYKKQYSIKKLCALYNLSSSRIYSLIKEDRHKYTIPYHLRYIRY